MAEHPIKNFDKLAINEGRRSALEIIESGLEAINTSQAVESYLKLNGNFLHIDGEKFDLGRFKRIKVVGFGKSSPEAAKALENILGDKITDGAVIGLQKIDLKKIESFAGTHPKPSLANADAGKRIYEIISNSEESDLVIALVSGGGSALLCYPEDECSAGAELYDAFLKTGGIISEMNTVRKHLSPFKGGGLAKLAYPATVIGLIFSDVPGDAYYDVASGPTYKDETTVFDAEKIIKENKLGGYELVETPKEEKYFKKVHNFVLVSNRSAIMAMKEKSLALGFETRIVSYDLYDKDSGVLRKMFQAGKSGFWEKLSGKNKFTSGIVVLAAGEPSIAIPEKQGIGKGGRNTHLSLLALKDKIRDEKTVFISFASDGMDNSDMAGGIADAVTLEKAFKNDLEPAEYAEKFNSYEFFQKTGDLIDTGPTGANVSDLMILLKSK